MVGDEDGGGAHALDLVDQQVAPLGVHVVCHHLRRGLGLRFRVQGLGFRVLGLGCRNRGFRGFEIEEGDTGCGVVKSQGFRVSGFQGSGFKFQGSKFVVREFMVSGRSSSEHES